MSAPAPPPPSRLQRVLWALPWLAMMLVPPALLRFEAVRTAIADVANTLHDGGLATAPMLWGLCVIGGTFALPLALVSALCGFAYGAPTGALVAVPGHLVSGSVSYLLGRLFLRGVLKRRLAQNARWKLIDEALARRGFPLALLLRLTPIVPQNLLPFLLATTRLGYPRFAAATLLGSIPVTLFQVYIGSLIGDATRLSESGGDSTTTWISVVGGILLSALALYAVSRVGRRVMQRILDEQARIDAAKEAPSA